MKNKNRIVPPLVLILCTMVIPYLVLKYFENEMRAVFHARLAEENEKCHRRFTRDRIPSSICDEIERNARLAFDEATHGRGADIILLTSLIGGLGFGLLELRRQVEELKEKKDV